MVDSDFFTEFNKFLVIEQNRILLDYKNCDYTLELYLCYLILGSFPTSLAKKSPKSPPTTSSKYFLCYPKKVPIKAVYGVIEM